LVPGTINSGIQDQVLLQVSRGTAGRCAIGAGDGDVVSGGHLCDRHEAALNGVDRIGGSGDVPMAEIKEKLGLD